ncbi:hypothetical protein C8R47DRAFT_263328 [Mycena vitilis]|nr:hypothetical protein C8R47DRAFT_263328 [Mycena vitilis]
MLMSTLHLSPKAQNTVVPGPQPSRPNVAVQSQAAPQSFERGIASISSTDSSFTAATVSDAAAVCHASNDGCGVSTDEEAPTRTLKLAGGNFIAFRESEVPDPPATSYSKRVGDLLSEWDDNSVHWKTSSPLKINGSPIALVYWPSVYKYWKGAQWRGIKKVWFEWKILFHAMTAATTLDDFWAQYYAPDRSGVLQRLKYTPLLSRLAQERKAENERLSVLARQELTTEQLTYRRGSQYIVMTSPAMIAAHYRKLKGLDANDMEADDEE